MKAPAISSKASRQSPGRKRSGRFVESGFKIRQRQRRHFYVQSRSRRRQSRDLKQVEAIASLPSKEELISKLLFVINAQAQRIVTVSMPFRVIGSRHQTNR
jgi:hypothetical protein